MTLVSIPLMDRTGRRTLHLYGLGGMFIFSIFITISFLIKASNIQRLDLVSPTSPASKCNLTSRRAPISNCGVDVMARLSLSLPPGRTGPQNLFLDLLLHSGCWVSRTRINSSLLTCDCEWQWRQRNGG